MREWWFVKMWSKGAGAQRSKVAGEQRSIFATLRPCDESGQSLLVMFLITLPLLLLVLGVAHDLGNVAAGVAVAQNAADLAAHEAGKLVDVAHFIEWQEVRLRPNAERVAQDVAGELTGGVFRVDAVYSQGRITVVEGRVSVRTPFLHMFLGVPRITRRVQGVAETAHGIEHLGE